MIPAERIQHWATRITPVDLGAAIILAAVACTLLVGLIRSRPAVLRSLPGLLYVVLATVTVRFWADISAPALRAISVLILAALALHFRYGTRDDDDLPLAAAAGRQPATEPPPRGAYAPSIEDPFRPAPAAPLRAGPVRPAVPRAGWAIRCFSILVVLATTVLLLDDLNDFAGTLLAWESPVAAHGMSPAFESKIGFWQFLRERLLWDDGVLSAGHTSLFFGPPTYLLFDHVTAAPWTLRLSSVVATLLALAVLYSFVGRYFGRLAAVAATACFGLSTPVLFYGRYGSSIAGTILAVTLGFYATWFFLERGRWTLLRAVLCGAALFVATLQYSPGRLAVLFLLATIPCVLLIDLRRTKWAHWVGMLLIAAMAWGVWSFEAANQRHQFFLHARGEHVLGFFHNPNTIPALVGVDQQLPPGPMDRQRKLEIIRLVMAKTFAELVTLISPNPQPRTRGAVILYDPPPMTLYYAPVAVFALLGIARSLVAWRSWHYGSPLLFSLAYAAVLLFTNRIDPHRGALLLLPLAMWFGIGVTELGRLARRLRVPKILLLALALALAAAAVFSDILIRYDSRQPNSGRIVDALRAQMAEIPGPVAFWFARDHREQSWLGLALLDKGLRSGEWAGKVVPQSITDGLRQDRDAVRPLALRQAARLARQGTLLLGPRSLFTDTSQQLQAQGLRVATRDAVGYPYLRIDGGAAATGVADSQLQPMAIDTPRPTPTASALSIGRLVYLSDLDPAAIDFGFAPPRMNATWHGSRVQMGGIEFAKAIGTHAWSTLRFAVPADAFLFQAIVGLSDDMRSCDAASVEFELRGDDDSVLWKSPLIDSATPPLPVEILVAGQRHVTLITGEAGDGRDCDHGNWGRAAFVFRDGVE